MHILIVDLYIAQRAIWMKFLFLHMALCAMTTVEHLMAQEQQRYNQSQLAARDRTIASCCKD